MEVFFPGSTGVARRFAIEFIDLPERAPTPVGPALVTAFEVAHVSGAPSYAIRLEYAGKVVAYSGDTEWCESLIEAARGANVFVCEAYFFDKPVKYHLDCQMLLSHREELGCRRLILTHMSADMLRRIPDIDVECAEDGKIITV
jgi:ribonuclease BN (tRNA processing enzyme)